MLIALDNIVYYLGLFCQPLYCKFFAACPLSKCNKWLQYMIHHLNHNPLTDEVDLGKLLSGSNRPNASYS